MAVAGFVVGFVGTRQSSNIDFSSMGVAVAGIISLRVSGRQHQPPVVLRRILALESRVDFAFCSVLLLCKEERSGAWIFCVKMRIYFYSVVQPKSVCCATNR